ncbi:lipocalin-like [Anabas testudineus]|uniref:Lipocalin/cytosolic fatty-acid binding domain-containing protein n=1 Tax=Anabas testudineus TaxID=64144 RepID=A0A3Q1IKW9_ANATE|nr:lipocalin-like [Anabas testudineus]
MSKELLRVLAALVCVLATCADVTPVKDFSLEKIAGKWYMVGFATNAQWFTEHKTEMKTGTCVFVPTVEGNLDLSYARLRDDGTCWRLTQLANKTDTPGHFTYQSQVWNNDNDMRIVDVLYDDYALVYTIQTKAEVTNVVNELLSRTQETSVVLQQKFTQWSLDNGILADNIVILPKNNECPEEPAATPQPTDAP